MDNETANDFLCALNELMFRQVEGVMLGDKPHVAVELWAATNRAVEAFEDVAFLQQALEIAKGHMSPEASARFAVELHGLTRYPARTAVQMSLYSKREAQVFLFFNRLPRRSAVAVIMNGFRRCWCFTTYFFRVVRER